MATAKKWDEMMLAERKKVDVLHDDHLVVLLDEHGAVQNVLHVLAIARREVAQRLLHALGSLVEALALHVLAQLLQELGDQTRDRSEERRVGKGDRAV